MVNLSGPERPKKPSAEREIARVAEKLTGEDKSEAGGEQMDEEADRDGKKERRWDENGGGGIPEGPR